MLAIITNQLGTTGGPVLIALAVISVAATATALFKILQFINLGVGNHKGAKAAVKKWCAGNRDNAIRDVATIKTALGRVVYATMYGITTGTSTDREDLRETSVHAASNELAHMSRHVRILEAVVQAAPMLGLLGTVLGMIDAFEKMSQAGGAVDPAALAGGIWTALTTTAVGLTIAIPFYFISLWLEGRIERERSEMESIIISILHARNSN